MVKDDCASGVRVVRRSIVKGSVPRPRVVVPVSNLDLLFQDVPVSFLCVYPKPSGDLQFQDVVAAFTTKLPSLLDYFPPLACRIVADPRSGLPELDCDNQGAEVVVCEVGEELGSLHYGDLEASLARIGVPVQRGADGVALSLQLVSFACGGFAVVWGSSHVFLDGCAQCMIINAWSELAVAGKISAAPPNHNRSVFQPRAPPAYDDSSIGELFAVAPPPPLEKALLKEADACFVGRTYYLEKRDLAMLRAQAGGGGLSPPSRMEAVSAYLWKVLATTVVGSSDEHERCRMAWWVNGRRHLTTTAPAEAMRDYFGNVTSYAVAEADVEGIKRRPLHEIVSMMRESIKSTATDEHFQQLVDWVEDHKGKSKQGAAATYVEAATLGLAGSPLLALTSFASYRFNTDFGFGQATYAMPIWMDNLTLSCGFVTVTTSPDGSCFFFSMSISPSLAVALDSDEQQPLTADYLRLATNNKS